MATQTSFSKDTNERALHRRAWIDGYIHAAEIEHRAQHGFEPSRTGLKEEAEHEYDIIWHDK